MEGGEVRADPWSRLPNLLSGLRILCAVVLPFSPRSWWIALVFVAAASDWLDGYVARRLHASSLFGAFLDSVSDKVFAITALVSFAAHGLIEWWQLPFLILRDLCVGAYILASVLRRDRQALHHMDSRAFGKLTTLLLFGLLISILLWPLARPLHGTLYSTAVIVGAAASVDYFRARRRKLL